MEYKEIKFEKEKIAVIDKISNNVLNDLKLEISQVAEDFVNETMTMRLTAFIYSNLAEERNLDYYFERPTFLDWLLRRKRKATFNLKVKDLLLDAGNLITNLIICHYGSNGARITITTIKTRIIIKRIISLRDTQRILH